MQKVLVNGTTLFCHSVPQNNIENNVSVIVLHGGPGLGCHYLLPQMDAIGNFCSAIFYDQRGTGQSISHDMSSWAARPFQTYLEDLDALRKNFGFEKITLLAHSWGSILASMYVLAYKEHVDKVIYLNPVPISSHDYLAFVEHRSQIVDRHKNELSAIRESQLFKQGDPLTVKKFYRLYFKNYFAKPKREEMLTLTMSQEAAINNFKIYELFYEQTKTHLFDLYEDLKKANKESLIIAGDKDVIPFHYTEKLHANAPTSELFLIKNCGHFPYIDQPQILFKKIESFLKS